VLKQIFIYWKPKLFWLTANELRNDEFFKAENSLQLAIADENNSKMLVQQMLVVISAIREYFSN
jgi:hypothetical protein